MVTSQEARLQCTVACFNERFVGEKKLPLVMDCDQPNPGDRGVVESAWNGYSFFFSRSYVSKFGSSSKFRRWRIHRIFKNLVKSGKAKKFLLKWRRAVKGIEKIWKSKICLVVFMWEKPSPSWKTGLANDSRLVMEKTKENTKKGPWRRTTIKVNL
jgi:hypothetical protein